MTPRLGFWLPLCGVIAACGEGNNGPLFAEVTGGSMSGGQTNGSQGGRQVSLGGSSGSAGDRSSAGNAGTAAEPGSAGEAGTTAGGADQGGAGNAGHTGGKAGNPGSGGASGGTLNGGGSAGEGAEAPGPCEAPHIIDDLEDRDDALCRVDRHMGAWFTANDGTTDSTQTPAPGSAVLPVRIMDRPDSEYAMHSTGRGFTGWGANLGFNLRSTNDAPFDASSFSAITFYAKGRAPNDVRVGLRTQPLATPEQGGTCVQDTGDCFKYHGAVIQLAQTWKQYRLTFASLKRVDNWEGVFASNKLVGVEFRVMPTEESFDIWIDDVRFEE